MYTSRQNQRRGRSSDCGTVLTIFSATSVCVVIGRPVAFAARAQARAVVSPAFVKPTPLGTMSFVFNGKFARTSYAFLFHIQP